MKKILLAQSGEAFGEEEQELEPGAAAVLYQPGREAIVVDKKAKAIQTAGQQMIGCSNSMLKGTAKLKPAHTWGKHPLVLEELRMRRPS
ncbi:hypothetical protein MHYP_G00067590 [Metynnis hypsauchen]